MEYKPNHKTNIFKLQCESSDFGELITNEIDNMENNVELYNTDMNFVAINNEQIHSLLDRFNKKVKVQYKWIRTTVQMELIYSASKICTK